MNKKIYQSPEAEIEKFKVNCDSTDTSGGFEDVENNVEF
jgi:hypothetical protein